jgi:uncharacterized protein YecE (DUF72 family)
VEPLLRYLFDGVGALGERLGALLFQLPPNLKVDLQRLESFLSLCRQLAPETPLVLEFRHESWFVSEVFAALERHGAALCGGEGDDEGRAPPPLVETARFAYLRLRKETYERAELEGWARRIQGLSAGQVFVYFKHETTGPLLAEQLALLLD